MCIRDRYGFALNVVVGAKFGPVLWFGWHVLNDATSVDPLYASIVSPLLKIPVSIETSNNLGTISIPLVPSKNG